MMRFSIIAAVALLATNATAQDVAPVFADVADAPATGKIVLYRQGAMMGFGLGCPIRFKEREVVELGRNKYAELDVKPGKYILTNKTSSVMIDVDAGETAYVRCTIKTGMLTGRADLQYADKESFEKQFHEFEKKTPNFVPE